MRLKKLLFITTAIFGLAVNGQTKKLKPELENKWLVTVGGDTITAGDFWYAFVKNAYFENLEFRVTDGKSGDKAIDDEQLDDFADFEAMLEGNDFDSYEETSEEGVDESTDSEDASADDSEKANLKGKDSKSKDGK